MSSFDPIIVGDASGSAIGPGYRVIVRDVGGVPIGGTAVTLSFAGSGVRLDAQQAAGTTVTCATQTISRIADISGTVVFSPRIGGYENTGVVQLRADGVLLTKAPARSTDLDADGQTDLPDLQMFRANFLFNRSAPETDYNADGVTNVTDLGIFRTEFVSGVGGSPCP